MSTSAVSPKSALKAGDQATDLFTRPIDDLFAGLGQFTKNLPATMSVETCASLIRVLDQCAAKIASKLDDVRRQVVAVATIEVEKQAAAIAKQKETLDLMCKITRESAVMSSAINEKKVNIAPIITSVKWGDESSPDPSPKWNNSRRVIGILKAPSPVPMPAIVQMPASGAPLVVTQPQAKKVAMTSISVLADPEVGVSIRITVPGYRDYSIGGSQNIGKPGKMNHPCKSAHNDRPCEDPRCDSVGHTQAEPQLTMVDRFIRIMSDFFELGIEEAGMGGRLRWAITGAMLLDDHKVDLVDPKLNRTLSAPLVEVGPATNQEILVDLRLAAERRAPLNKAKTFVALVCRIAEYVTTRASVVKQHKIGRR